MNLPPGANAIIGSILSSGATIINPAGSRFITKYEDCQFGSVICWVDFIRGWSLAVRCLVDWLSQPEASFWAFCLFIGAASDAAGASRERAISSLQK